MRVHLAIKDGENLAKCGRACQRQKQWLVETFLGQLPVDFRLLLQILDSMFDRLSSTIRCRHPRLGGGVLSRLVILLIVGGGFLYMCWNCGGFLFFLPPKDLKDRSATAFVMRNGRSISDAIEVRHGANGVIPPGHPYFGPLTVELQRVRGIDAEQAIDPYNQTVPRSERVSAPRFATDRGAWITPAGGPLMFATDGASRALLISRGPDFTLGVDQDFAFALLAMEEVDVYTSLSPLTYDPTNGTSSSGHVFRRIWLK